MATKATTPNDAQAKALAAGVETGFLPGNSPNEQRTAEACVRRGWAVKREEFPRYAITDAGRLAIGAGDTIEVVADEAPADEVPTVDLRADEVDEVDEDVTEAQTSPTWGPWGAEGRPAADEDEDEDEVTADEPVAEVHPLADEAEAEAPAACPQEDLHGTPGVCACGVITMDAPVLGGLLVDDAKAEVEAPAAEPEPATEVEAPAADPEPAGEVEAPAAAPAEQGKPGLITLPVQGMRVHHVERITGGCTRVDHRNGVMTGQGRITQGRDHVQVKFDCGHLRWPLLRVLIEGPSEGYTPPAA